jgi:hypothetical protein
MDSSQPISFIYVARHLWATKKTAIWAILANFVALLFSLLALGIKQGLNYNEQNIIFEYYDYNNFYVSRYQEGKSLNSGLSIKKTRRPSVEEMNQIYAIWPHFSYRPDLRYYSSNYQVLCNGVPLSVPIEIVHQPITKTNNPKFIINQFVNLSNQTDQIFVLVDKQEKFKVSLPYPTQVFESSFFPQPAIFIDYDFFWNELLNANPDLYETVFAYTGSEMETNYAWEVTVEKQEIHSLLNLFASIDLFFLTSRAVNTKTIIESYQSLLSIGITFFLIFIFLSESVILVFISLFRMEASRHDLAELISLGITRENLVFFLFEENIVITGLSILPLFLLPIIARVLSQFLSYKIGLSNLIYPNASFAFFAGKIFPLIIGITMLLLLGIGIISHLFIKKINLSQELKEE